VPKLVRVDADLPFLPIGKIDKTALKRRAAAEPAYRFLTCGPSAAMPCAAA
jgi:hypothetical protein